MTEEGNPDVPFVTCCGCRSEYRADDSVKDLDGNRYAQMLLSVIPQTAAWALMNARCVRCQRASGREPVVPLPMALRDRFGYEIKEGLALPPDLVSQMKPKKTQPKAKGKPKAATKAKVKAKETAPKKRKTPKSKPKPAAKIKPSSPRTRIGDLFGAQIRESVKSGKLKTTPRHEAKKRLKREAAQAKRAETLKRLKRQSAEQERLACVRKDKRYSSRTLVMSELCASAHISWTDKEHIGASNESVFEYSGTDGTRETIVSYVTGLKPPDRRHLPRAPAVKRPLPVRDPAEPRFPSDEVEALPTEPRPTLQPLLSIAQALLALQEQAIEHEQCAEIVHIIEERVGEEYLDHPRYDAYRGDAEGIAVGARQIFEDCDVWLHDVCNLILALEERTHKKRRRKRGRGGKAKKSQATKPAPRKSAW